SVPPADCSDPHQMRLAAARYIAGGDRRGAKKFKMKAIIVVTASDAALVTGLIAAWYWHRSTKVPLKTTQPDAKSFEMAGFGLAAGAYQAYQAVAALNKKAALWTAASVVLSAISALIGVSGSD